MIRVDSITDGYAMRCQTCGAMTASPSVHEPGPVICPACKQKLLSGAFRLEARLMPLAKNVFQIAGFAVSADERMPQDVIRVGDIWFRLDEDAGRHDG